MNKTKVTIFWFRRDLRINDNHGLYRALQSGNPVLPVFIFDTHILDRLDNKSDRRVDFIHQALHNIQSQLTKMASALLVLQGTPLNAFTDLQERYEIEGVYCNHDYEPAAIERDEQIADFLQQFGVAFHSYKDQVIFEKEEVVKDDQTPYTVFTPYMNKYKKIFQEKCLEPYPSERLSDHFLKWESPPMLGLQDLGFQKTSQTFSLPLLDKKIVSEYHQNRDIPSLSATSKMSVHLRFGTISIRSLVREAIVLNEKWWNELIWREFYMMILYHFPHVVESAFKPAYNHIAWRNNPDEFESWCQGKTGYPIVDAGMRELNKTGFMHNRVRMIVASFLTKHLLVDWRWGEAYFAKKLLDFELSSNNGGWQWAASSGCDAAPYFRVFNPYEQTKKFDPQLKYIRKWVPEFESFDYQSPIVAHTFARERVLKTYKASLDNQRAN